MSGTTLNSNNSTQTASAPSTTTRVNTQQPPYAADQPYTRFVCGFFFTWNTTVGSPPLVVPVWLYIDRNRLLRAIYILIALFHLVKDRFLAPYVSLRWCTVLDVKRDA
eukprot:7936702-Pyramimonas_sp.AAC.1